MPVHPDESGVCRRNSIFAGRASRTTHDGTPSLVARNPIESRSEPRIRDSEPSLRVENYRSVTSRPHGRYTPRSGTHSGELRGVRRFQPQFPLLDS